MVQTIPCECGETLIGLDGMCVGCSKDRRPPVCPSCHFRHFETERCNFEMLNAEDTRTMMLLELAEHKLNEAHEITSDGEVHKSIDEAMIIMTMIKGTLSDRINER